LHAWEISAKKQLAEPAHHAEVTSPAWHIVLKVEQE
jgi:hypothetical protein